MKLKSGHGPLFLSALMSLCLVALPKLGQSAVNTSTNTSHGQTWQPDSLLASPEETNANPIALTNYTASITSNPLLSHPVLLKPIQTANPDPLIPLDQLVVKQSAFMYPYVPLIQELAIGIDYGKLLMNIFTRKERRYAGSLGILLRRNIQLAGDLGYKKLHPGHTSGNLSKYEVSGFYSLIGLSYLSRYSKRDNLYAGLRYGRSHFTNRTKPDNVRTKAISKNLTASWFELVGGSETRLFAKLGLYTGLMLRLGILWDYQQFKPASNYVIPGYGKTANKLVLGLSLYIQYRLSFLNKQISFD